MTTIQKDFVFKFPPNPGWVRISGNGSYTVPSARYHFWDSYQLEITRELQKEIDLGFVPVSSVGPSSISVRTYWSMRTNFMQILFTLFFVLFTWGVGILFVPFIMGNDYAEPTECRIALVKKTS